MLYRHGPWIPFRTHRKTPGDISEAASTATFLGGDKAESAILLLVKSKMLGQTIALRSDATYIVLQSGNSPHVIFKMLPGSDGGSATIQMIGGDQPTLFLDGKEQMQQQGKWMQVVSSNAPDLRLELETCTFAKVKFEAPAVPAQPIPAAMVIVPKPAPGAKELLQPVTPNQLLAVCHAFDDGINKKCAACSGTGWTTVRAQTGSQTQGIYSVPIYETHQQKCDRCHGSGVDRSKDDVLIRLAGAMVRGMAGVNHDDPKAQTILTDAYNEITKDMIGDQKCWTTLTSNGRSILAQTKPAIGSPVVSMVEVNSSLKLENDHRRYLVRVLGTDKQVYVDDPTLADELKSGHALMGGVVDRPLTDGDAHITVLHGGFLVAPPIEHNWWWWNRGQY